MAKVKNSGKKKSTLSLAKKNAIKKKVTNPFEVHVNRQKYEVLGRKVKNDRGLPGVARAKAMKKRKDTLLQEYRVKDKSNKFMDRRIGEKNRAMTGEDRIMARFAAERMKSHNKKSMFNLADDEVLTHHGQTLNELEKFDDPRSEDEDDGDEGKLDAAFVKEAHFGGGILSRSGNPQSRKDLIEQLITESKKRKLDQKKSREQTQELTDKLDTEWKDLLPIIATSKRKPGTSTIDDVDKPDEYDTMMRELKFEARGKPSDRLKSEDEIAKEEKERLEKLEADRIQRMHGFTDTNKPKITHRSADDLDDGFAFESDIEDNIVSYGADGKLENRPSSRQDDDDEDDEAMDTDEEQQKSGEEDSDEESSESEEADDLADLKTDSEAEDEQSSIPRPASIDAGMETESSIQYVSPEPNVVAKKVIDIVSDSDNARVVTPARRQVPAQQVTPAQRQVPTQQVTPAQRQVPAQQVTEVPMTVEETEEEKMKTLAEVEKIRKDLLARKEIMETARKELPYTFKVPECYEDLQELMSGRSPEYQAVILERIIKCNHPSLADGNKDKLATLLAYLLQHLHDVATQDDGECFVVLDRLAPHLYDLAIMAPGNARRCVAEVLKEKQHDYRKRRREFPQRDTLVFLKLVSLLFPTSDFRHPVTTPAFVFMGQMLARCQVKTRRDVATGLFIATLMLEFTVLSKRFSPEVIAFLQGLLSSASTKKLLSIPSLYTHIASPTLLSLRELSTEKGADDSFRYMALTQAARLLQEFAANLSDLPAVFQIFAPVLTLKATQAPQGLQEQMEKLQASVNAMNAKNMPRLIPEAKKPKVLRLYEPKIEKVFDGRKHRVMSRERQEKEKLIHKVKRETKGAIREIRRDRTFIAKLKIKQTKHSDMERKARVKEIYGSASIQQGELKALARKK